MLMAVTFTMPVLAGPPQDFTPVDISILPENQVRGIQMFRICDENHDHVLTKPELELCKHPRAAPLRATWENLRNNTLSEKEFLEIQQYAQNWIENWVAEFKKGSAYVFRIYQSNAVLGMISEGMLPVSAEIKRPWENVSAADVTRMINLKYGLDIPSDSVSVISETYGEETVKPKSNVIYDQPLAQGQPRQSPTPKPKQKIIHQRMKNPQCVIKPVMTNEEIDICR
jgi:hypothetical protein